MANMHIRITRPIPRAINGPPIFSNADGTSILIVITVSSKWMTNISDGLSQVLIEPRKVVTNRVWARQAQFYQNLRQIGGDILPFLTREDQ